MPEFMWRVERGGEAWIESPSISCGNIDMSSFAIPFKISRLHCRHSEGSCVEY